MEITDLPNQPPHGYANWTRLYEDVLKNVNPKWDSYFVLHHRPNPNVLTTFQRQSITTKHRIADLKQKVFDELWETRLTKDDVYLLVAWLNQTSMQLDEDRKKKFAAMMHRLDHQWRADLLREV